MASLAALAFSGTAAAHHYAGWHWYRLDSTPEINPTFVNRTDNIALWGSEIQAALNDWAAHYKVATTYSESTPWACADPSTVPTNEVYLCTYSAIDSRYAYASVPNYGHASQGVVGFNYYYNAGATSDRRRALACHEIGHIWGLYHRTSTNSCLNETSATPEGHSLRPDGGDYDQLTTIYKDGDDTPYHDPAGSTTCHDPPTCPGRPQGAPLTVSFWRTEALFDFLTFVQIEPWDVVDLP